jgi:hypothetical protein
MTDSRNACTRHKHIGAQTCNIPQVFLSWFVSGSMFITLDLLLGGPGWCCGRCGQATAMDGYVVDVVDQDTVQYSWA